MAFQGAEAATEALEDGLYKEAEDICTRAMKSDPSNPALYECRSAARIQLKLYEDAAHDGEQAIDLDPDFVMGYFRLGVALQCLGDYPRSIISFSEGIKRDQKNPLLLNAIIEAALVSPIRSSLEPVMSQLRKMQLDANPFVITSVVGQELLSNGQVEEAVEVLENAVSIGTRSLKLKGSVFSALSSALWSLGETDRAIHYMKQDLTVSRTLSDNVGECRAHGNLGAAYFSQQNYQLARENHNRQLALAQSQEDHKSMVSAFSSLGHIYTATGEHQSAAESHKQSAAISRNIQDTTGWCRQLGLVAASYLTLGDLDSALQWQLECLRVTTDEFAVGSQEAAKEEAKARVDLAIIYHKMQKYTEEITCLQKSVEISRNIGDITSESQTLLSLGYITRHTGDIAKAQASYERLLELALTGSDRSMEARACASLGVIHHRMGDYEMALKLQARNLELSTESRDVASQGRAHGNIGNAYSAMRMFEQAVQHHTKELEISATTGDRAAECSTHGNLAVAYQALRNSEKALHHYSRQASLASQIGEVINESRAYMNLGNFHSSRKEFRSAIDAYTSYLTIVENHSFEKPSGIAKACYNAAFAYFSLRDYRNAITFYEKCLEISLDLQDAVNAARAYCNLGLSWKAFGDTAKALECQNCFLTLSNQLQSTRGIFKALGNIGDIYISQRQPAEAVGFYQQQYDVAKQANESLMLAQASGALGVGLRLVGDFQKSIEFHTEELQIYQSVEDSKNEFKAHGHLGAVLTSLGEFSSAAKCYENQCYIAERMDSMSMRSTAVGNMGITSINLQDFEKAIDFFERQLLVVENLPNSKPEKAKVLCNIGDCYEVLENYDEAITLFEEALEYIAEVNRGPLLERVYHGLSSAYKLSNKPQEAFKFCRLRVDTCRQLGNLELLAEALGEMGFLFTMVADYESALSCLEVQMEFAQNFLHLCGDAACGLGIVYQIMRDYKKAVEYHQIDLQVAIETDNLPCQGRAHGNLGAAYGSLHLHRMAVKHQEQHLFIADNLNDPFSKLTALRGLARSLARSGTDQQRAVLLLQQALALTKERASKQDEGKIILDLALTSWSRGDMGEAETNLLEAEKILTDEFWKSGVLDSTVKISVNPNSYINLFEEIQTCRSALSCLYVETNQHQRAVDAAEKLRLFPELVMRKRLKKCDEKNHEHFENITEKLEQYCVKTDSPILYYSVQNGAVLMWGFTPEEGFCGFTRQPIYFCSKQPDDTGENLLSRDFPDQRNLLTHLIFQLHDSLGLESPSVDPEEPPSGENEEPGPESVGLGEKRLNKLPELYARQDPTFQMYYRLIMARTELHYSRNLTSMGIVGVEDVLESNKTPIYALHDLLIGNFREKLQKYATGDPMKRLVLVVEGDLLMVPFALLKGRPSEPYLSQQFCLQVVTSARDLLMEDRVQRSDVVRRGVVVGNPDVSDMCGVPQLQASEDEANLVGTLLKTEPLTGRNATKEMVLSKIQATECFHVACNVSSKPPFHVLLTDLARIPEEVSSKISSDVSNTDSGIMRDSCSVAQDDPADPDNREVCLTPEQVFHRSLAMGDLLNLDLSNTKVIVIGSAHLQNCDMQENLMRFKTARVLAIAKSFMTPGAHALLLPLWPVPETACKLMIESFYSRLMGGMSATEALRQSLGVLRSNTKFEHPSYWAGFVLIGRDVTLDPRNFSLYHALKLVIRSSHDRLHDVLRLVVHLVDKSLERMETIPDSAVPMYASQLSVSRKVGDVNGWREVFSAVGFELRQSANGIPDAVFFPGVEAKRYLLEIKEELISYLQLSVPVLSSLNRFFSCPFAGHELKQALQACLEECRDLQDGQGNVPQLAMTLSQTTWRLDGSADLLTATGFKVSQIGEDIVMLHCPPDHRHDVETVFRLLSIYFESPRSCTDPDLDAPEKAESVKSEKHGNSLIPKFLNNSAICGLPPSNRRSIAVDFNSSFKSQSSLDSSQHLELPDHMTTAINHDDNLESVNHSPCRVTSSVKHDGPRAVDFNLRLTEPEDYTVTVVSHDRNQNMKSVNRKSNLVTQPLKREDQLADEKVPDALKTFIAKPSSNSVIVPKPKIFQNSPGYVFSSDPFKVNPTLAKEPSGTSTSNSIQRSKRFQFHGFGSSSTTFDTLEVKLPRNPQKSPMFYRKADDENQEAQAKLGANVGESQKIPSTDAKNVHETRFVSLDEVKNGANGHELPLELTTEDYLVQNGLKSPTLPLNSENTNHFIPIHNPTKVVSHSFEHKGIVHPKPKRPGGDIGSHGSKLKEQRSKQGSYVPAPSVAKGIHSKSKPFDYTHVVDKLTRLRTDDHFAKENRHVASSNGGAEASRERSTQEYNKVMSCLEANLPQIISATDLVPNLPRDDAREVEAKPYGSHVYSRSLDSTVRSYDQKPTHFPHQHSLSQDGGPPPPYQHPEFVTSPRRASEDVTHSRASSYASRDSVGSPRGTQLKKEPGRPIKQPDRTNSNQSFGGYQVLYELETSDPVPLLQNVGSVMRQGPSRFGYTSNQYRAVRPPQPASSGKTGIGVHGNRGGHTSAQPTDEYNHAYPQPSNSSNLAKYQHKTEEWF